MGYYRDFREYLARLEEQGYLYRIKRPINKDTELHPIVRWQFRGGIPETKRKAFLFENVTDSQGASFSIPVVVGALGASRFTYALGMQCRPEEIFDKWERSLASPIEPVMVSRAPVHEVVYTEDDLKQGRFGVHRLPVPISTPGFDNAPYLTCSHWITKDPETGIRNVGNYRAQIKEIGRASCRERV